jgi:hypothetical protein
MEMNLSSNMLVWFMVFNATSNNISVISWRSILLVEETGVPGENHQPVASNWQTISKLKFICLGHRERSFLWSYGSWIYNYKCTYAITVVPITTKVVSSNPRSLGGVLDTTLYDKVCQWLATGWWFSPGKFNYHTITRMTAPYARGRWTLALIIVTLFRIIII